MFWGSITLRAANHPIAPNVIVTLTVIISTALSHTYMWPYQHHVKKQRNIICNRHSLFFAGWIHRSPLRTNLWLYGFMMLGQTAKHGILQLHLSFVPQTFEKTKTFITSCSSKKSQKNIFKCKLCSCKMQLNTQYGNLKKKGTYELLLMNWYTIMSFTVTYENTRC